MKYEITYVNPSHTVVRERTETFNGKAFAREFVQRGRQYSGSFELISVVKVTPKGTRTEVTL